MALTQQELEELKTRLQSQQQPEINQNGLNDSEMQELSQRLQQQSKTTIPEVDQGGFAPVMGNEEQVLNQLLQERQPQQNKTSELAERGLGLLVKLGEGVDKYGGSTTARSAISSVLPGGEGFQFAPTTQQAPTGQFIAEQLGVPKESEVQTETQFQPASFLGPEGAAIDLGSTEADIKEGERLKYSPSAGVGFGVELALDPTAPVIKLGLAGAKALGKGARLATKWSALAADTTIGGNKAAKTLEVGGEITESVSKALDRVLKPRVSKNFKKHKLTAKKIGILDNELPGGIEFDPDSIIARKEAGLREIGAGNLKEFNSFSKKVANGVDDKIAQIGNGNAPMDNLTAGEYIINGFNNSRQRLFNSLDITHDSIPKLVNTRGQRFALDEKGMSLLNKGLNKAKQRIKILSVGTGPQRDAANDLIKNTIAPIIESGGDYEKLTTINRGLGEAAFSQPKGVKVAPDTQALRDIYFAINDAREATVKNQLGGQIAEDLINNNKMITKHFKDEKAIAKSILSETADAGSVFNRVTKNSKGIDSLKELLTPEQFKEVKASIMNNIIVKGADGNINYLSSLRPFENPRTSGLIKKVFDPQDIVDMKSILELGYDGGAKVLSSSGTGASNALKNLAVTAKDIATSEAILARLKSIARGEELKALKKIPKNTPKRLIIEAVETLPPSEWGTSKRMRKALKIMATQKEAEKRNQRK